MQYKVYNNSEVIQGTFDTLEALGLYMDDVRNRRGEYRHNSPVHSTLDYIKSIGWYWEVVDT
tara:strand:- start:639 stop:824 length:186 start_codon:yes stop_codon:yes gene_type:complete